MLPGRPALSPWALGQLKRKNSCDLQLQETVTHKEKQLNSVFFLSRLGHSSPMTCWLAYASIHGGPAPEPGSPSLHKYVSSHLLPLCLLPATAVALKQSRPVPSSAQDEASPLAAMNVLDLVFLPL